MNSDFAILLNAIKNIIGGTPGTALESNATTNKNEVIAEIDSKASVGYSTELNATANKQAILDAVAGISGGSNPTGGIVDIATVNYNATLQAQFNTLDVGSSSAALMNLPNSIMEPMNLYLNTIFYSNYSAVTNATNDNIFAVKTSNGIYLPGIINPAHLRLSCHFEGTGSIPSSIVSSDSPVYNSILGTIAPWNLNNNIGAVHSFTGGTPSATSGTAANAFDNSEVTYTDLYNAGANAFVKYDLGVGNAKIINIFFVHVVSPGTWTIAGSNDNTSWTTLTTLSSTYNAQIRVVNTTAYRYYKISSSTTSNTSNVYSFFGYIVPTYDITNFKFGSSAYATTGNSYTSGVASNVNEIQLGNLDWHFRGFFRFSTSPNPMALFTIAGKQLEILATSTGLRVNYSTNGTSFTTVDSSAISWSTATWYFISIRRTGNTLYFYVDNVAYGTADLTGVTLFPTVTNSFILGADTAGTNLLNGNVDELEFFVGESIADTIPVAARSTAYIPAVSWQSAATYIKSGVAQINILVFFDEVQFASFGVPVVETDSNFLVSLDNGTTWSDITMVKVQNLTVATVVYSGALNTTGLANTNQLKYKVTSPSGKIVKFDGVIMYWV